MPWNTKADVARHNLIAANDPALRKQWKAVANGHLLENAGDTTGAIKKANSAVSKKLQEQRAASNVISDAEILSEFNFRSLGHNIVNRTLAKMGSGSAQGRLDRQETLDQLMNEYNTFLGHQRAKPTYASLLAFLEYKFDKQFAVNIGTQIAKGTLGGSTLTANEPSNQQQASATPAAGAAASPAGATPAAGAAASPAGATPAAGAAASPAGAAAPATAGGQKQMFKNPNLNARANDILGKQNAVKNDTNFYADKSKQAGVSPITRNYQQNTFKQLNSLVSSPTQDTRQIIGLTKEILAHANDHGGNDKARVMAYLQNLRKNPRVLANPKLAQMFTGLRLESIRRTIDMAMFLVENEITTKKGLNEAVNQFFLIEKPFGRAPNTSGRQTYDNGLDQQYSGKPAQAAPAQPAAPASPAPSTAAPGADALRARYNARMGAAAPAAAAPAGTPPTPPAGTPPTPPAGTPPTPPTAGTPTGGGSGGAPTGGPSPSNPNAPLSRKQLVQYFGAIASILLKQGKVDFINKNPKQQQDDNSDSSNDHYDPNTRYVKMANGRYKPANEPKMAAPAASSSSNYNRLESAFRKEGLDHDRAVQKYLQLLRQGRYSGQPMKDALKNLPPEAVEVLHSVAGH